MTSSTDTPHAPQPRLAALDGDILLYRAAHYADAEGVDALEGRIEADLEVWTPPGCDKLIVMLSDDRANIFRKKFWPSYKEHRNAVKKPDCLGIAVEILKERVEWKFVPTLEADDLLGIMTSMGSAVCVTTDKDLRQVSGWHWNPDRNMDAPRFIDPIQGSRWFHTQWVSGDTTDHFPGIPGLGPAKTAKLVLDQLDPKYWTLGVMALFESRKFSLEYALAQRACARILTIDDWDVKSRTIKPYVWEGL